MIDATLVRNVAAFINHTCDKANLKMVHFYRDHKESNFVTVGFQATVHVGPGEELMFNYGDKPDNCWCPSCKLENTKKKGKGGGGGGGGGGEENTKKSGGENTKKSNNDGGGSSSNGGGSRARASSVQKLKSPKKKACCSPNSSQGSSSDGGGGGGGGGGNRIQGGRKHLGQV